MRPAVSPQIVNCFAVIWAVRFLAWFFCGSPYVTGDNLMLTAPVGAQLVHIDQFHCGPIVEETHANPNFVIDAGQGIDVDVRGHRFMDETIPTLRSLWLRQPRRRKTWLITSSMLTGLKPKMRCEEVPGNEHQSPGCSNAGRARQENGRRSEGYSFALQRVQRRACRQ